MRLDPHTEKNLKIFEKEKASWAQQDGYGKKIKPASKNSNAFEKGANKWK